MYLVLCTVVKINVKTKYDDLLTLGCGVESDHEDDKEHDRDSEDQLHLT